MVLAVESLLFFDEIDLLAVSSLVVITAGSKITIPRISLR